MCFIIFHILFSFFSRKILRVDIEVISFYHLSNSNPDKTGCRMTVFGLLSNYWKHIFILLWILYLSLVFLCSVTSHSLKWMRRIIKILHRLMSLLWKWISNAIVFMWNELWQKYNEKSTAHDTNNTPLCSSICTVLCHWTNIIWPIDHSTTEGWRLCLLQSHFLSEYH